MINAWLLAHCFCVFYMTGVIWIIQIVHYPLMKFVSEPGWMKFHKAHTSLITWVVAPPMIAQAITSIFTGQYQAPLVFLSLAVFLVTLIFSIPIHNQLAKEFKNENLKKLILMNWIRTLIWTGHSLFLISILIDVQTPQ